MHIVRTYLLTVPKLVMGSGSGWAVQTYRAYFICASKSLVEGAHVKERPTRGGRWEPILRRLAGNLTSSGRRAARGRKSVLSARREASARLVRDQLNQQQLPRAELLSISSAEQELADEKNLHYGAVYDCI